MEKQCARCKADFTDTEGFLTCEGCRIPSPEHGHSGGCQRWGVIVTNPRIHGHERLTSIKQMDSLHTF